MMALETYNKKRDFAKTPEPQGEEKPTGEALRFVVQLHDASRLHYDFRLEWDGVLLSWAVPKGPSYNPKDKRLAVHVEDHPLDYRTFEGTIPKGEYGGGTVMVWDDGTWEPQEDFAKGLKAGSLKIILHGKRLYGRWALIKMRPKPGEEDKNWLLIKEKDKFVKPDSGIKDFNTSVVTERTLEEIAADAEAETPKAEASEPKKSGTIKSDIEKPANTAKANPDLLKGKLPFSETNFMLAKLTDKIPRGDNWLHELKLDGYRIMCFLEDGKVKLVTRNGLDWTDKFSQIAAALTAWNPGNMIFDGEMVVFDESGKSDFQSLQSSLKNSAKGTLHYILFDCLALGSTDLRSEPLSARKDLLAEIVKDAPPEILYSFHQADQGQAVFDQACTKGQEGIISKRADSKYSAGRGDDWLKIKCDQRQEFVIGGYTTTDSSKTGLSALLLGVNSAEDGLTYIGRAGTGFTEKTAKDLLNIFKNLKRKTSPFSADISKRSNEKITYLRPSLLAEIKYAEITNDGLLRQASFKGLRSDKQANEVVMEQLSPQKNSKPRKNSKANTINYGEISLSSPDKLMFPDDEISKQDVADYYWLMRDKILPYLTNRPMTLIRCTDGIEEDCFFQKHLNKGIPGMETFPFKTNSGEDSEAMIICDEAGLMGSIQMGAIEFHGWGSTADSLEQPDMIVFDLDPDEGMDIEDVRRAVMDLKQLLDETSLTSYLKTSGGKGYHIVVPLRPAADWEKVRDFAKLIAQTMVAKWPELYTDNMRKVNRKGRVYVDWVRNGRGATSVCNFSLRSRKGAAIAWPLRWSDLTKILPNEVTLKNHKEYKKTLSGWKDFFDQTQELK
ncbi:MAG: DNA ligase D [Ruminococcaceae bacterium]|nr:DNA ligase D [Oscillospiraceae bacterium]